MFNLARPWSTTLFLVRVSFDLPSSSFRHESDIVNRKASRIVVGIRLESSFLPGPLVRYLPALSSDSLGLIFISCQNFHWLYLRAQCKAGAISLGSSEYTWAIDNRKHSHQLELNSVMTVCSRGHVQRTCTYCCHLTQQIASLIPYSHLFYAIENTSSIYILLVYQQKRQQLISFPPELPEIPAPTRRPCQTPFDDQGYRVTRFYAHPHLDDAYEALSRQSRSSPGEMIRWTNSMYGAAQSSQDSTLPKPTALERKDSKVKRNKSFPPDF